MRVKRNNLCTLTVSGEKPKNILEKRGNTMRKEKLITRTIVVSNCEFMCVDVETANVEIVTAELTGKISKDEALKIYKSTVESDTFKVVSCQSIDYTEQLYGMSEKEFIKHAKVLPPRKTAETEETEGTEE